MSCSYAVGFTIADILQCTMYNIGIPFDVFALGIIGIFLLYAMWARLDFNISLGISAVLCYTLIVINGNASDILLQILLGLLILGIGVRVLIGLIAMLRQ